MVVDAFVHGDRGARTVWSSPLKFWWLEQLTDGCVVQVQVRVNLITIAVYNINLCSIVEPERLRIENRIKPIAPRSNTITPLCLCDEKMPEAFAVT